MRALTWIIVVVVIILVVWAWMGKKSGPTEEPVLENEATLSESMPAEEEGTMENGESNSGSEMVVELEGSAEIETEPLQ
ncbi:MAG: hypothetical protein COV07_04320 [Candidatus Vogelbacteria bacterium CG10_big_fil_rev_8_21_14_0_10_45_14]|uniref:Uncharacterized protein n=1 Tax=Candidatus Vogelbacteria bacterium CG10_big_fil_rev_8_21_14_0_10_45_14 TaxID=1975042 RepID=A0A2H0RIU3_9BACT|nr:MAG: hypothetical protein COV07_04320 [Candidatus Vogelbacteria bacterium CG10_big_fil_rev_8_21_14_0_10_45_14]